MEADQLELPPLPEQLGARGVSRRQFLEYCVGLTAVLALPMRYTGRIARALAATDKPGLVWLEFQDCAGNSESFLRARDPSVADLVLDLLSIDYHETIMAAAGAQAEAAKQAAIDQGGYLVVVEGSIPTGAGGAYCTIGGRSATQLVKEAANGAAGVIAVGTCAAFGGIPAAAPNPTGALGVDDVVSGVPVVNLSGCPANAENITATLVHYLTFGELPATDGQGRPLFAYGERIHDACQRRAHYDAGQFALEWGDEGHRKGWCLYKLGCKGPETFHNCPVALWNGGTSWPVAAGHGCVGCSEPHFWDTMTPFYRRLPKVPGFGVETTADEIGIGIVGGTAALFAAHGVGKAIQNRRRRLAVTPAGPAGAEGAPTGSDEMPAVPDEVPAGRAPDTADPEGEDD